MVRRHGFTLVELLVVIGVIALLISVLMPALSRAQASAARAKCLSNMRNMEMAHIMYCNEHKGVMIQAGLAHGGAHANEGVAWINTLQRYYQTKLLVRCPSDESPHWEGGIPLTTGGDQYRRTSYGINEFLDKELCPWGGPYVKITQIRRSSTVIHFLEMAENGEFAGADHPHVDLWVGNIPAKAAGQLETSQHGGTPRSWDAMANYGFLDGHAETLRFRDAFTSRSQNRFDPAVAP